jgi:DNA-directed RNA polymerase subunit omega
MARITVEDCLKKVDNRFTLIHMAAKRVRQLRKGAEQTIVSKNKDIVVSLREIVAGNVIKAEGSEQNHLTEGEASLLPEAGSPPEADSPTEAAEEQSDKKAATKASKKKEKVAEGD